MPRFFVPFFLLGASFLLAFRPASAVPITIDTVPVGNLGNAADPSTDNLLR